jgi:hypothetical protein
MTALHALFDAVPNTDVNGGMAAIMDTAIGPIVTNANGRYLKLGNGLILQWGTRSMTTSLTTSNFFGSSSGTTYYKDEYQTLPYTMPSASYSAWANSSGSCTRVNDDRSTTQIRILVFNNSNAAKVVEWYVLGVY